MHTVSTYQVLGTTLKKVFFALLIAFGFNATALAADCSAELAALQVIANNSNQNHANAYAPCISCCGGIAPQIPTNLCGGLRVPYYAVSNGKEAWIEGTYCNPFVVDGGSCNSGRRNIRQCDLGDEKQETGCSSSNPSAGDPIIVATGNSAQTETDYQSSLRFGLSFIRYYNSSASEVHTSVGKKWSHNYYQYLAFSDTDASIHRSNGQTFFFSFDGNNWVGDVDVSDTLEEVLDAGNVRTGWVYTDSSDTVETYNAQGQLLTITNRAGQTQTFIYDITLADGGDENDTTLDKVVSYTGDELIFEYDDTVFGSAPPLTKLTDPEGNIYHYAYDGIGNLISVTYPDDTLADLTDNPVRIYHYENTAFPHHLTGLTDETGSRVTWAFDTEGRAISSELDGGVDKVMLDYTTPDQVTVTNPLGKDTTYHFSTLHGVKKVTQVEGHATPSCAGANQNYSYDANGYLASKTDWQGNTTTYIHDARGLEISRTEASGTADARIITTTWHPDFRLPLTIAEPGKVTTFTYDGQGRQLSQTAQ